MSVLHLQRLANANAAVRDTELNARDTELNARDTELARYTVVIQS